MKRFFIAGFSMVIIIACSGFMAGCSKSNPENPSPECVIAAGSDADTDNTDLPQDNCIGNPFTAAANQTINQVSLYLSGTSGYSVGIYSDNGGQPGSVLSESGVQSGVAGWNTADMPAVAVTAGTDYWIVVITESYTLRVTTATTTVIKFQAYLWDDIVGGGMPSGGTWSTTNGTLKVYISSCS